MSPGLPAFDGDTGIPSSYGTAHPSQPGRWFAGGGGGGAAYPSGGEGGVGGGANSPGYQGELWAYAMMPDERNEYTCDWENCGTDLDQNLWIFTVGEERFLALDPTAVAS